jgi:hypothetical protein
MWYLNSNKAKTMEAIRKIQSVENGQIHLQLPEQFWGQDVEIIVLAVQPTATATASKVKNSLRGSLKCYADPAKMEIEPSAWLDSVEESDEHR